MTFKKAVIAAICVGLIWELAGRPICGLIYPEATLPPSFLGEILDLMENVGGW